MPGQSGPKSNGNEGVPRITQSSSITGTSPSGCLVSYPGHSLGGGLTPLQRCSRCILQPQSTGQSIFCDDLINYTLIIAHILIKTYTKNILFFLTAFRDADGICPPSHRPDVYGERPFLRWVRVQGWSSHAPEISKNASDPVGILLKGAPQVLGNKPNLFEEG